MPKKIQETFPEKRALSVRERKQERFFWIFVIVALINVLVGSLAPWYVETIFLIFSIIGLIGCANWLGVPWVVTHLERWLDRVSNSKSKETE